MGHCCASDNIEDSHHGGHKSLNHGEYLIEIHYNDEYYEQVKRIIEKVRVRVNVGPWTGKLVTNEKKVKEHGALEVYVQYYGYDKKLVHSNLQGDGEVKDD